MNFPCIYQIDEAMKFTEEEERLLTDSLNGIAKLLINYANYTTFTIYVDSQENLNKARAALGRCVIYIYKERNTPQSSK